MLAYLRPLFLFQDPNENFSFSRLKLISDNANRSAICFHFRCSQETQMKTALWGIHSVGTSKQDSLDFIP